MDLNKVLSDAEYQLNRLSKQAMEEKAMAEVLPIRYTNNMEAFKKYIPNIYDTFSNYSPQKGFRFFCSENGEPNVAWKDTNVSIYGDSPFSYCETQIEQVLAKNDFFNINFSVENNNSGFIHVKHLNRLSEIKDDCDARFNMFKGIRSEVPFMLMFGCGLGYQLGYLYQACNISNLFLFEPDMDLFYASIYCFDWAPLLEHLNENNLGFHIFLGVDKGNIMTDLLSALYSRGSFLASSGMAFWHYPSDDIFSLIDLVRREFHQLTTGWGFFDDNMMGISHCIENLSKKVPFLKKSERLDSALSETPIFIIANGPSLDSCIEFIKSNRKQAIYVSCGSTITALLKAGIKPDIHVETERTKLTPDFFEMMNEREYLKDIFFFGTDVLHPDTTDFFNDAGLCFKSDEPSGLLCYNNIVISRDWVHLEGVNPTVGNIGVAFACAVGFKNIYLFGLDNGYRDSSYHHSKMSVYFNDDGHDIEDVTALVVSCSDPVVEGNFGGVVRSPFIYNSSRRIIELVLGKHNDISCVNCSDGAKISGAKSLHHEELHFSNEADHHKVMSSVKKMFSPIPIDAQTIELYLDSDFFTSLIDLIIADWQRPLTTRNEVIMRMMHHFSYLDAVSQSRQRHIYKVLVGSMNYMYSILNVITYRYENDNETLQALSAAIDVVKDYLCEMKTIYPQATKMTDNIDHQVLDLFRASKINKSD
ncbi:6-hydroxymethylpterin diphosphokinase MptE-like protein [Aeromonas caviae]|uniref:motility associated factor glycosyltransferase family protein n=1 Tax=Aeromonas caviae TaxID=648 RepID=UPI0029D51ECA|nr:6-hydroxymethylpterin diphosphokinase MptE-like protein [Aeromonas caviae]MDX7821118.1 6-hydroxymethylpterin diphosphokinase MptE-like protein [Aeromonas caviae]